MNLQIVGVVLAVLVGVSEIDAQTQAQYCTLCKDHTMCKYTGVAAACGQNRGGDVTSAEQATILSVHNAERSRVALGKETRGAPGPQPAAANMVKLVWNTEIASIAQRLADQCKFAHDTCRKTSSSSVGQNLYMSSSTSTSVTSNWTAAINAWNDEVAKFNKAYVSPYQFTSATGHYTQAVWATTTSVGCGRTVFKANGFINQLYVCNYAPAGNVGGASMYVAGKACSKCPATQPKCETATGLCTA